MRDKITCFQSHMERWKNGSLILQREREEIPQILKFVFQGKKKKKEKNKGKLNLAKLIDA